MKLALSETIAKSATLLMRAVDELHSTGSFRYDKPFTPKKKCGRKIWNKSKQHSKSTIPISPPTQYKPEIERTDLENRKLNVFLSALNAEAANGLGVTPDEVMLVLDSGASCTLTPSMDDFIGPIKRVQNTYISGIASGLEIKGTGTVEYRLRDDSGNVVVVRIENVLYVPQCPVRLICPQQVADQTGDPDDGLHLKGSHATMHHNGHILTIPYGSGSNLPTVMSNPGVTRYANWACRECNIAPRKAYLSTHEMHKLLGKNSLEGGEDRLTEPARELLMWHRRLSHRNMDFIQQLARDGILPRRLASVRNVPSCPDCKFGEQTKRAVQNRGTIDASDDAPGRTVSGDQMEAHTPGLTMMTKGRKSKKRHKVATVWIDHYSRFITAHSHCSTTSEELVNSKAKLEAFADSHNVKIKSFRTDNGAFISNDFNKALTKAKQKLTACGVGAHWQNGIAERYIGSITRWARTLLLHAMTRWPQVVTEEFWTFAVNQAVNIHNATRQHGKTNSPWQMYTNTTCPWKPEDFQVFGSPVYVLDKNLQDGNSPGKWQSRSRVGVYVGHSSLHSGNVVLVLNPETNNVSPQFHVVFDNGFSTVGTDLVKTKEAMDKQFQKLFTSERWNFSDEYEENVTHRHHFDTAWNASDDPDAVMEREGPQPNDASERTKSKRLKGILKSTSVNTKSTKRKLTSESPSREKVPRRLRFSEGDASMQPELRVDIPTADTVSTDVICENSKIEQIITPDQGAIAQDDIAIIHKGAIISQDDDNAPSESSLNDTNLKVIEPTKRRSRRKRNRSTTSYLANDGQDVGKAQSTNGNGHRTKKQRRKERIRNRKVPKQATLNSYPKVKGNGSDPSKTMDTNLANLKAMLVSMTSNETEPDVVNRDELLGYAAYLMQKHSIEDGVSEGGTFNMENPVAYKSLLDSMNNKEDILTQGQMLKVPDAPEFKKAQEPEIAGLEDLGVFGYQRKSTVPKGTKILRSVWTYRRKRRPDGTLLKYKARLCADGSRQEKGIDYEESYAPVVAWSTVRMALIISTLLKLEMRQIDFIQAFPQADTSEDIYMQMPAGWEHVDANGNKDYIIKLKKNLYGTATGARNWYKKLASGLIARDFKQSSYDPCLFLRGDCMFVVYTDDCICFSKAKATSDQLIADLKQDGFLLKDEGDAKDFLGVNITRDEKNNTIEMTQTGLIDSILDDLGLNSVTEKVLTKNTPSSQILHHDRDGEERQQSHKWSYRSIIGKLNYLAMNTRPDISFAVHQCAKFCQDPKLLHEKAVKYIGRYLYKTKDKGIILKPEKNGQLDAYVDSDFAGRWHRDFAELRESVLSRTGYVVTYCGCPIVWSSKLQTEIALSTTEAEYIALSSLMRTLLPMRQLIKEIYKQTFVTFDHKTLDDTSNTFSTTMETKHTDKLKSSEVFEDNAGCIVIATSDAHRPRTKHLAVKWHHFKDQVRSGACKITKVASALNWADIFTKPVDQKTFEVLRLLMMGW